MRKREFGHGVIYNGDCLDVMLDVIEDHSIDMILADLPYGKTQNKWDIVISFEPLWKHYESVIKQKGAIVLTAAEPFASFLVVSNHKLFKYDLVWNKSLPTGFLNANRMPLRVHESILVFYKSLPVYNPVKWQSTPYYKCKRALTDNYGHYECTEGLNETGERFPVSILDITNGNRNKNGHPTEKPVALFEYLIKTYTNKGDIVLDNVIGSGTTAIAAYNTGRKWVGIEKDPDIFDMACERIEKETLQQKLFN